MIRGVTYARAWALAAGAALATAGGATAWLVRSSSRATSERVAQVRRADDLGRAIALKGAFDDAHLEEARNRARLHPVPLAVAGAWQGWAKSLGVGWQISRPEVRRHAAYAVSVATVRLVAPAVSDWPRVLAAVRETESRPGFGVLEVELRSEGDQRDRSMQSVSLVVGMGARLPAEVGSP
jgi:hypothetical protein